MATEQLFVIAFTKCFIANEVYVIVYSVHFIQKKNIKRKCFKS